MTLLRRLLVAARRVMLGLFTVNAAACVLFLRKGKNAALAYGTYAYRLYSGYGLPWTWDELPWRSDLLLPALPPEKIFPEIDFTCAPEILLPFPRALSTMPHELVVLALLLRHFKPRRIVEFGTAEGRTTINLALHSPQDAEVITVNFPPDPPRSYVGYFYWEHPLRSKIKQIYADATRYDWTPYRESVDLVFVDGGDAYQVRARETAVAFRMIRPGAIVLWHDYGTSEGSTTLLNQLRQRLPVSHIAGTALACLHLNSPEILNEARKYSEENSGLEPAKV